MPYLQHSSKTRIESHLEGWFWSWMKRYNKKPCYCIAILLFNLPQEWSRLQTMRTPATFIENLMWRLFNWVLKNWKHKFRHWSFAEVVTTGSNKSFWGWRDKEKDRIIIIYMLKDRSKDIGVEIFTWRMSSRTDQLGWCCCP